jgi:hypothetical protein
MLGSLRALLLLAVTISKASIQAFRAGEAHVVALLLSPPLSIPNAVN